MSETRQSFCDLDRAMKKLSSSIVELETMTEDVGNARVVKELHGERMKQALAKAMAGAGVDSMAKAEVCARIDPKYLATVETLADDLRVAEKVLIKRLTIETRIEGLRSAIALERALIGM